MRDRLTDYERDVLLAELADWTLMEHREAIQKEFRFKSFNEAFGFMTRSALLAEKIDHHPEWSNVYNRVDVVLTTHSANGLTELDARMARAMNKFAE
ncbi:4a-hydroxytetrahydrobiopterin dehydratase [Coralliovum pocilloporae]|uniref:4a-hydroxytetrahydrobiopterin dehydratase n=1 Tax=Coralliovum pocilloporae TaxID=3066369 RepID=UPI003307ACFE